MEDRIAEAVGDGNAHFVAATRLATALIGDSIATNPFMLGYAYQKGLIPIGGETLLKAIEVHGVAVASNRQAFLSGRRAAHDLASVEGMIDPAANLVRESHRLSNDLEEVIARRVADLTAYQNAAYARRYESLVERVRRTESERVPGKLELTRAVAGNYYRLLAYKDEYEVARLHTDPEFLRQLDSVFEGDVTLTFHMAPPILARPDPVTGEPRKRAFGPWMMTVLRVLARLKGLRGTPFDVFGYSADRKLERQLLAAYEQLIDELLTGLDARNHDAAVELALLPAQVRGFGHVKERHVRHARERQADLLRTFRTRSEPASPPADEVDQSVVIMAG